MVYKVLLYINVLMIFYYLFQLFPSLVKGKGMGIYCLNLIKLFLVNIWLLHCLI